MRLLADESVDFALVRALRTSGHDVISVAEQAPGATDEQVAGMATSGQRILVTEDRDFGRLVYAEQQPAFGVMLFRYPAGRRAELVEDVMQMLSEHGEVLVGAFVVMQPGRMRVSRLPDY